MHYIFSSFTGLPDSWFDGFCFVGADYVAGSSGFDAYRDATGATIPPGEDGCYLTIRRVGSSHEVGSDYAGYKKIFYYFNGRVWAISNSIVQLAKHLSDHGVRLTINYPQLVGFKNTSTLALQLSSFRTIFNEIDLLPSWNLIRIDESGLKIAERPEQAQGGYEETLTRFANTWANRLETLIRNDKAELTVDLTGGADSRTVFSLVEAARRKAGKKTRASLIVKSHKDDRWQADLAVAKKVARSVGVRVNRASSRKRVHWPLTEAFNGWKDLNIGIYLPIYFPGTVPDFLDVHLHGGGGEKYRQFYKPMAPSAFVDEHIQQTKPSYLFSHWKRQFLESVGDVLDRRPDVDPLVAHYGEFRNRLHAGRSPQYRAVVSPLASKLLDPVVMHSDKVNSGQINFDLMESLLPGIAEFEFDEPGKAPDKTNWQALTRVRVENESGGGRAYTGDAEVGEGFVGQRVDRAKLFHMLATELEAAKGPDIHDFFEKEYLKRAEERVANACKEGTFGKSGNTRELSCILTAAFAFRVGS